MSEIAFWFRRDLRLQDNHALFQALAQNKTVRLFFIFDPQILKLLKPDDHRVTFIWNYLQKLNQQLQTYNNQIEIYFDQPHEAWLKILKKYPKISAVYTNRDYEPMALARDMKVQNTLKLVNVDFFTFKDQVVFEKDEVLSDKGSVYHVYTPYKKKWLSLLSPQLVAEYPIELQKLTLPPGQNFETISLAQMGFSESHLKPPAIYYNSEILQAYGNTRDYPALEQSTTHMGLSLRFGLVSVRSCVRNALKFKADVWLSELIWREFFMQILFHYPRLVDSSFRPEYDKIAYRKEASEFERWSQGMTGVPLVDAGMRELNATGYMHNRVRMMVASYLTKHLLHYWKEGERYFAQRLFDFDLSANIGNWQWAAGCGVDAAPYFRIFNAELQAKKFDPQMFYIKKWVPEYNTSRYPSPIVDHEYGRKRALAVFKEGLKSE